MLVFSDGFEDESYTKSEWQTQFERTWDIIHFATDKSYEGAVSIFLESGALMYKTFETMVDAYIKVAFYDLMQTSDTPCQTEIRINDDEFMFGVAMHISNIYYTYNINKEWFITTIKRSAGWHIFEIWVNQNGISAAIDGNIVLYNNLNIKTLSKIALISSPGPSESYWDAVEVHSPAPNYPEKPDQPEQPEIPQQPGIVLMGGIAILPLILR
jgi:hypothetical protein